MISSSVMDPVPARAEVQLTKPSKYDGLIRLKIWFRSLSKFSEEFNRPPGKAIKFVSPLSAASKMPGKSTLDDPVLILADKKPMVGRLNFFTIVIAGKSEFEN